MEGVRQRRHLGRVTEVPDDILAWMDSFGTRKKQKINQCELLAVITAVMNFSDIFSDSELLVWVDNVPTLSAAVHGYSLTAAHVAGVGEGIGHHITEPLATTLTILSIRIERVDQQPTARGCVERVDQQPTARGCTLTILSIRIERVGQQPTARGTP